MSNVALSVPKTISSAVVTGSLLGTAGTSYFIKVHRARVRQRAGRVMESTGDGDAAPAFESSYWQYLDLNLMGWMPAASVSAFLLASAWSTSLNPLASSMKLWIATGQVLTIPKALITDIDIDFGRTEPYIPMYMQIKATDTVATWSTS